MLLVPRQLRRSGMTGSVPYYGGRLNPAQAYAAAHPSAPIPPGLSTSPAAFFGRAPVPGTPAPPPSPQPAAAPASTPADPAGDQAALEQLLASGVITAAEFDRLRGRVAR